MQFLFTVCLIWVSIPSLFILPHYAFFDTRVHVSGCEYNICVENYIVIGTNMDQGHLEKEDNSPSTLVFYSLLRCAILNQDSYRMTSPWCILCLRYLDIRCLKMAMQSSRSLIEWVDFFGRLVGLIGSQISPELSRTKNQRGQSIHKIIQIREIHYIQWCLKTSTLNRGGWVDWNTKNAKLKRTNSNSVVLSHTRF